MSERQPSPLLRPEFRAALRARLLHEVGRQPGRRGGHTWRRTVIALRRLFRVRRGSRLRRT